MFVCMCICMYACYIVHNYVNNTLSGYDNVASREEILPSIICVITGIVVYQSLIYKMYKDLCRKYEDTLLGLLIILNIKKHGNKLRDQKV